MSDPFSLDDDPALTVSQQAAAQADPGGAWLSRLNPEQAEAVRSVDGPVLVLSGAGTGKTRVLTTRLAYILAGRRAQPWQILAVTFTNRAAREMRERVVEMIGPMAEQVWLGTFHALGAKLLRRHAELVGLKSNFTILDTDDQLRLLKQLMESEGVDSKRWPAPALLGVIQRWKDRGLSPAKASAPEDADFAGGRTREIYRLYQERLIALNACDFGDLLLHVLTLFQDNPDILTQYQEQFRYILVDEYQDTNVAQYLWLRLLARKHKNICCVGDDDQAIYSWRGAEVGNILRFDQDFPGAKVVRLETNYRSTPHILAAASGLIAHNRGRLGKELRAGAAVGAGEPLLVRGVWDGEEEARWVIEEVEAFQARGERLSEIAILVRAGFQTREFEERLITTGVPYRVVGGPRFYERMEIRDALAYLRVLVQPDDDLAFERILNKPKRGLGDATVQVLHGLSRSARISLTEAAGHLADTDELKPKARQTLQALLGDFARWRAMLDDTPHPHVAATVLDESGYLAMWRADKSPEAPGRLENLKELVAGLNEFESLYAFLEHVSLVMENDAHEDVERLSLMTLHAAKGLEFDIVFLPGWEEGLFPHQRAMDEGGGKGLEEDRRLAYVGLTRARRRVLISFAANRRVYNEWRNALPSRFIDEVPRDHVEVASHAGLMGGRGFSEPRTPWRSPAPERSTWTAPPAAAPDGLGRGQRVFHEKFGYGKIIAVDGPKLTIAFDKAGEKKVMAGFV
ncbi:MAG: DNA helicase II, partial [Alphaproteobacteria bacterium RIFOXYD12_FULL_60_8]